MDNVNVVLDARINKREVFQIHATFDTGHTLIMSLMRVYSSLIPVIVLSIASPATPLKNPLKIPYSIYTLNY